MKLAKVFACQEHSGGGIVILLIQRQHAKGGTPGMLKHEARPHDQSQQKKVHQIMLENLSRNILPKSSIGAFVCDVRNSYGLIHRKRSGATRFGNITLPA